MSKARELADLIGANGEVKVGKVGTAVSNLVDSAPAALNTLNELAAALGDDANFSTTVTDSIALKAPIASPSFTGNVDIAGSLAVDVQVSIEAATGFGTIEMGGPSGAYIDMKSPMSDDYDLRIITTGTGGYIDAVNGFSIQHSGSSRFITSANGVGIIGDLDVSGEINLTNSITNYIDYTDSLRIRAASSSPGYESSLLLSKDGGVTAYHNGAARLNTTSTGINVTGQVVAAGEIQQSSAGQQSVQHRALSTLIASGIASTSWRRIATLGASNQPISANIYVHGDNRHQGIRIQLDKGTGYYTAEVYEAGRYTYSDDIAEVRIVNTGINAAVHVDIRWGATTVSKTAYTSVDYKSSANNSVTLVAFTDQGTATAGHVYPVSDVIRSWGSGTTAGPMVTLKESGNVGIGTVSPSQMLSVSDGAHITVANATAADSTGAYTLSVGANTGAKSAKFAGEITVDGAIVNRFAEKVERRYTSTLPRLLMGVSNGSQTGQATPFTSGWSTAYMTSNVQNESISSGTVWASRSAQAQEILTLMGRSGVKHFIGNFNVRQITALRPTGTGGHTFPYQQIRSAGPKGSTTHAAFVKHISGPLPYGWWCQGLTVGGGWQWCVTHTVGSANASYNHTHPYTATSTGVATVLLVALPGSVDRYIDSPTEWALFNE